MTTGRAGCLAGLLRLIVLCALVLYILAGVTSPWAFHIGGRWTPLLYWSGYGKLATSSGTYPLYVIFYPSARFSRLPLDGLRPSGGLQGTGTLCVSPGKLETLKLGGTIYGGWSSTNDALLQFRLLEIRYFGIGQQGYFDLYGRWHGSELVMDDRNRANAKFRSGLEIKQASITVEPGSYSDFKAGCATSTAAIHP